MHRIALSCRPTQNLETIVEKAFKSGIRTFDTPFIPRVPLKVKELIGTAGAQDKRSRFLLRTTETDKDALEFQIRTFASAVGNQPNLQVLSLDPEYDESKGYLETSQVEVKIGKLFDQLQRFTDQNLIQGYGISSNGLTSGALRAATIDALQPGSGFKVIQFPANLIERQGLEGPLIDWATKRKLEVCVNRPLTAFDDAGSWRFVEAPFPEQYVASRDALLAHVSTPPGASEDEKEASKWFTNLVNRLDEQLSQFTSIIHWESELGERILPMIDKEVEELDATTHQLLSEFLHQFGLAVRESGGFRAREHLLEIRPELGEDITFRESTLHAYALDYIFKQPNISLVSIHASNPEQIDSWEHLLSE